MRLVQSEEPARRNIAVRPREALVVLNGHCVARWCGVFKLRAASLEC